MVTLLLWAFLVGAAHAEPTAEDWVRLAVAAHGGKEAFYRMRDVQFRLTVRDLQTGKTEISTERYLFEDERSNGRYPDREEFFDGRRTTGPEGTRHRRKANYFWFALPFKLLDSGAQFRDMGKSADHVLIDVTYGKNVGDVSDRYRLFINTKTKLIDQVVFRGPFLAKFEYEEVSGLKLAVRRTVYRSDWNGKTSGSSVLEQTSDQIQFWNGFTKKDFLPTTLKAGPLR